MKNNWKETFRNDYTTKGYGDYQVWNEHGNNVQKVEDFITILLEEQKKELMEDIKEALNKIPDNRHPELGDAGKDCECVWCLLDAGKKLALENLLKTHD